MQNQFDSRKSFSSQVNARELIYENGPRITYDFYFKIFGLVSTGLDFQQKYGPIKQDKTPVRMKRLYCQFVCSLLWFFTIRGFALMFISDRELQVMMGDLTGYWNDYRMYYLMPMFYYSLQAAITATVFLSKENTLAWLVPFLSVNQLQNSSSYVNRYDPTKHKTRTRFFVTINMGITMFVTGAIAWLYYDTAWNNMDELTFRYWLPWLAVHVLWFFYMAGITQFVSSYFNLVCLMISKRFAEVCKDIEILAESDPGPPGSKNNALTQMYFEHNEVCELVDESNKFWNAYIFFTFMTHIPCNCYALYNLFFAQFDTLLSVVTWTTFFHTLFILAIVSVSAANVSAEVNLVEYD